MRRFASGSSSSGEYRGSTEYDAGYRDGYRAAQERAREELAAMRAQLDSVVQAAGAAVMAKPITVTVSAETVRHLKEDIKHEGE